MDQVRIRALRAVPAIAVAALLGPRAAALAQALPPVTTDAAAVARARADSVRRPYTAADVAWVEGMIHHHAQAVTMARWCPTHTTNAELHTLCARIINAQQDEIHRMQQWLADRRQPVPQPDFTRDTSGASGMAGMAAGSMNDMPGMQRGMPHDPLMPGMLTSAQLDALDHARGPAFDRLFLTDMIQHHQGAVGMVKDLFGTYGAVQDEIIFKLASDINADQSTEINRMQRMLIGLTFGTRPP